MRRFIEICLSFYLPLASGTPSIHPCASEIERSSALEIQISDSTSQIVDLKSKTETERSRRAEILTARLEEASGELDKANLSALQDMKILTLLLESRTDIEAWATALPAASAFDRSLSIQLATQKGRTLPSSIQVSLGQAPDPIGARLLSIALALKSSREWSASLGEVCERVENGEGALATLGNQLLRLIDSTQGALTRHPHRLAQLKAQVSAAQAAIDGSSERQATFESRVLSLAKRLVLLKEELPKVKSSLNSCMHRVQFGE